MGGYWPTQMQLWRESAHFDGLSQMGDDRSESLCNDHLIGGSFSNRTALHCQYRYPSPRRFGPFRAGPTFSPRFAVTELCRFRDHIQKTLVLLTQTSNSGGHKTNQIRGSNLCNISVLSSPPRQSSLFPHVSTMISNVARLALQPVRLLLTLRVATFLPGRLLAARLAYCVTTSPASAAKTSAPSGAPNTFDRRSGYPLSGVFAF